MKISIIKDDNTVVINSIGFTPMDLSSVGTDVHAIQFDTELSKGHIEYNDGKVNKEITDITPYQSIIDSHVEKKTEIDNQEQEAEAFKETYKYKRSIAYPSIEEQMDMQYWDSVNGTTTWKDKIAEIKALYPKPTENN